MVTVSQGGGDYENLPVGRYKAQCYKIIDTGTRSESFQGQPEKKRHKLFLYWEITQQLQVENGNEVWADVQMSDGRPFSVSKPYTASLNENATLFKDLKSWRGRSFTDEELKGFELGKVLRVTCELELIGRGDETDSRTKIEGIYKPDGGPKVVETINEAAEFDIELYCQEFKGNSSAESKKMCDIWEDLPEWMKEEIENSFEVRAAKGSSPASKDNGMSDFTKDEDPDEDIPF
tara:strand:+ start:920 stop:1621 length:702 start_codon:yes stop_codon:yes gene_type:complete